MLSSHKTKYLSGTILILINLIPLIGVLFLQWNVFSLLMLYWLENIVIGFYNIIKIYKYFPSQNTFKTALFFMLHYGFFVFLHGIFILMLFASPLASSGAEAINSPFLIKWSNNKEFINSLGSILIAFILLILSHGFSCYINFIKGKEYETITINTLFFRPYKRILLIDIAILFGATITIFLESPLWLLILLVVMKLILDLYSHLREHENTRIKTR